MSATRDRVVLAAIVASGLVGAFFLLLPRFAAHPIARAAPSDEPTLPVVTSLPPVESAAPPPAPPPPAYVRENPDAASTCAPGMILVDGVYCPFVGHTCEHFVDERRDICETYGPDVLCEGRLEHRRYCVDRFEYPNLEGVLPAILVSFDEAAAACIVEKKRLCTAEEWEFACEGTAMWPFPNGRVRDHEACNIDRPAPAETAVAALLADPTKLSSDLESIDGRARSGSLAGCISPFGVRDTAGNVDEWVDNEAGKAHEAPFRSALKGGSWMLSRSACRPTVATHDASYRAIDVGFRCCSDARGSPKSVEPAPHARVPKRGRMPERERSQPH